MKPLHSNSLILVWRVAEYEARNLKASMIEPSHLLLGLCKIVDVDLPVCDVFGDQCRKVHVNYFTEAEQQVARLDHGCL